MASRPAPTTLPELADYLRDFEAITVVDTLRADGAPGEVRTYRRPEIVSAPISLRISPHEPGLREALLTAELTGEGPEEVLLVGVIPSSVAAGTGLGTAVREALPRVREIVVASWSGWARGYRSVLSRSRRTSGGSLLPPDQLGQLD